MGLLDDLYATERDAINAVPGTTRANYQKLKGLLGVNSTGNGLLSDLSFGARNALSQAKWNAGNRLSNIQRFVTDPEYRNSPEVGQAITEAFNQYADAMAPGNLGGSMAGMIKVSHGSPHAFDRFSMDKIGTGEGAQAYGHGLYFGEGFDSPVAKEYRDALSGVEVGGKVLKPEWDDPNYYPLQALRKHGDDIEKARQDVYERNARIPGGWPEELDAFESLAKQGITRNQGHLYNVELRWPDAAREAADPLSEHHLLDWDRPMSEQSDLVKSALGLDKNPEASIKDWPGYEFYVRTGEKLGEPTSSSKLAAQHLLKKGIPGIRYLDQGSRGAGQGTSNYVIFDDRIPKIITRNGKSLLED